MKGSGFGANTVSISQYAGSVKTWVPSERITKPGNPPAHSAAQEAGVWHPRFIGGWSNAVVYAAAVLSWRMIGGRSGMSGPGLGSCEIARSMEASVGGLTTASFFHT